MKKSIAILAASILLWQIGLAQSESNDPCGCDSVLGAGIFYEQTININEVVDQDMLYTFSNYTYSEFKDFMNRYTGGSGKFIYKLLGGQVAFDKSDSESTHKIKITNLKRELREVRYEYSLKRIVTKAGDATIVGAWSECKKTCIEKSNIYGVTWWVEGAENPNPTIHVAFKGIAGSSFPKIKKSVIIGNARSSAGKGDHLFRRNTLIKTPDNGAISAIIVRPDPGTSIDISMTYQYDDATKASLTMYLPRLCDTCSTIKPPPPTRPVTLRINVPNGNTFESYTHSRMLSEWQRFNNGIRVVAGSDASGDKARRHGNTYWAQSFDIPPTATYMMVYHGKGKFTRSHGNSWLRFALHWGEKSFGDLRENYSSSGRFGHWGWKPSVTGRIIPKQQLYYQIPGGQSKVTLIVAARNVWSQRQMDIQVEDVRIVFYNAAGVVEMNEQP